MIDERIRTTAVMGLCETIYQTKDYSLLPILADALDDAGYEGDLVPLPILADALDDAGYEGDLVPLRNMDMKEWELVCALLGKDVEEESNDSELECCFDEDGCNGC